MPPHHQGLQPLSFGLFHQQEAIRDLTVEIMNELRSYPVIYHKRRRVSQPMLTSPVSTGWRPVLAILEPFPALRVRATSSCEGTKTAQRPKHANDTPLLHLTHAFQSQRGQSKWWLSVSLPSLGIMIYYFTSERTLRCVQVVPVLLTILFYCS